MQTKINLLQPGSFKLDIDTDSDTHICDNDIVAMCRSMYYMHTYMPIDELTIAFTAPNLWPFSIVLNDGRTWAQTIEITTNEEPRLKFTTTDFFKLSEIQTYILPLRTAIILVIQLNKLTKLTAKWIS